jgi:hypothetical protein
VAIPVTIKQIEAVVTSDNDTDLIELAYAASMITLIDHSDRKWDEPIADLVPAELERECYRLAMKLGVKPLLEVKDLPHLQATWRKQFRHERHRDLFDMGCLLVRQHGLISYLQSNPQVPERPELCFFLDEIRQSLTRLFTAYELKESLANLPELPLPGAPDTWMTWSGDALRRTVERELCGSP